jgi:hypothetical protein
MHYCAYTEVRAFANLLKSRKDILRINWLAMHNLSQRNSKQNIQMLLLAAGTVLMLFLWQGHKGFELWDEGFLWYGAQRVMVGEVPIRDFMAYDPGRYYWSAALMRLLGDNGILALRGAVAIFQAMGLFIGLKLLSFNTDKPKQILLLLGTITLAAWMFPWFKLFDIVPSIALIGALTLLVQQPSCRRYFLLGLIVGLAAVFGRNHGVYGVAGSFGVMAYLAIRRRDGAPLIQGFLAWSAGIVIGYLPVLLLIAAIPGFALACWESIRFLFDIKATNLPLPVPWPWRVPFGQLPPIEAVRGVLLGLFFIAIVAFGILGVAWTICQRLRNKSVSPVLVASSLLALPYAHYAYSRADAVHLAQGIFPFLIGSLALLENQSAKIKWPFATLLCGASLLVMLPVHPGWQCYASQQCINASVGGSKLEIEAGAVNDLAMLNKLAEQYAPGKQSILVTPFWPGAYAALNRKSPMWEIYALFPRGEAFELAEIERIKSAAPGFALIIDISIDGRDDTRFRNTHPLIYQYILAHFEPLGGYTQNPSYQVYKRKQVTQ